MKRFENTSERFHSHLLIVCAVLLLLFAAETFFLLYEVEFDLGVSIIMILLNLPLLALTVYHLVSWLHYRNADYEPVGKGIVKGVDNSRDYLPFALEVEVDRGGKKRTYTTSRVFTSRRYSVNPIHQYVGKLVTLGFEPKRGEYVIMDVQGLV